MAWPVRWAASYERMRSIVLAKYTMQLASTIQKVGGQSVT
jgi:hypothetical protein